MSSGPKLNCQLTHHEPARRRGVTAVLAAPLCRLYIKAGRAKAGARPRGRHRQHPCRCVRVARPVAKDPAGALRATGPTTSGLRPGAPPGVGARANGTPGGAGGTDDNESDPSGGEGNDAGGHTHASACLLAARDAASLTPASATHRALPGHHPTHARRLKRFDGRHRRRRTTSPNAATPTAPPGASPEETMTLIDTLGSRAPAIVAAPAQAHRQPREHAPLPQRHQLHAVVSRRRPAARGRHLRPAHLAREHPLRRLPPAAPLASSHTRSTPSRSSCPRCSTAPRPTTPSTTTARARTSARPSPCSTSCPHWVIPACAGSVRTRRSGSQERHRGGREPRRHPRSPSCHRPDPRRAHRPRRSLPSLVRALTHAGPEPVW